MTTVLICIETICPYIDILGMLLIRFDDWNCTVSLGHIDSRTSHSCCAIFELSVAFLSWIINHFNLWCRTLCSLLAAADKEPNCEEKENHDGTGGQDNIEQIIVVILLLLCNLLSFRPCNLSTSSRTAWIISRLRVIWCVRICRACDVLCYDTEWLNVILIWFAVKAHKAAEIIRIKLLEEHLVGGAFRAYGRWLCPIEQIDLRDLGVIVIDGDTRELAWWGNFFFTARIRFFGGLGAHIGHLVRFCTVD